MADAPRLAKPDKTTIRSDVPEQDARADRSGGKEFARELRKEFEDGAAKAYADAEGELQAAWKAYWTAEAEICKQAWASHGQIIDRYNAAWFKAAWSDPAESVRSELLDAARAFASCAWWTAELSQKHQTACDTLAARIAAVGESYEKAQRTVFQSYARKLHAAAAKTDFAEYQPPDRFEAYTYLMEAATVPLIAP